MTRAFVIGHPIAHSRSPLIHGHWLNRLGIAGSYERIDVPPDRLGEFLLGLPASGYAGGNVTVPHKEAAFGLVGEATRLAGRLRAVNTVWVEAGRLLGDNTDGQGFVASLAEAVGPGWQDEVGTALILGAGGAARAILCALADCGVRRILVANRTEARAGEVAALAPGAATVLPWADLARALRRTDLVVNTTVCGMKGQPPLDIDLAPLSTDAIVADIVYVPLETPLLAAARRRGLRAVDGLGMLLHQAVPGFARWFGATPEVAPELRALLAADVERTS